MTSGEMIATFLVMEDHLLKGRGRGLRGREICKLGRAGIGGKEPRSDQENARTLPGGGLLTKSIRVRATGGGGEKFREEREKG